MKEIKLKRLEKSFEEGIINKEEYEKQKEEINEMKEEKREEVKEELKEAKLKTDRNLIIVIAVIAIIFIALFIGFRFINQDKPQTIEELHKLNLEGKLKPDQGYLYNDLYSFVLLDDFWYTQLKSRSGKTLYNFNFRYSPRDLEDIKITGNLDLDKFNNASEYFVTFNPEGIDFTHIRLARFDYDIQMTQVFQKTPLSACDRKTNATEACNNVPIITCDNTEDIVVYFKESSELTVEYDDNCIIISGTEFDFVKGVDRVLYNLYGIMEQ